MYKAAPPPILLQSFPSLPCTCQSVNILASYWCISQLASILLHYWSPVSPAEFNRHLSSLASLSYTLAFPPPHFPLFLAHALSLSFLFSSHFLSYPSGRHSVCLIYSFMWFPVSDVVSVGFLTITRSYPFYIISWKVSRFFFLCRYIICTKKLEWHHAYLFIICCCVM